MSEATYTITGNPSAGGWFRIPLSTPFTYDNTKTLIIEIQYVKTAGGVNTFNTSSTGNKRLWSNDTAALTGTAVTTGWSDIGLDIVPAASCIEPPDAGTATINPSTAVCAGTAVSLNLSGHTSGFGQKFKWQIASSTSGPWADISEEHVVPNYNTQAPLYNSYYRSVITCGVTTSYSVPVMVSVNPLFSGGAYTIDGSIPTGGSNYQTFADAVQALSCGIAGPVTFNVAAGTYSEKVVIGQIAGTSSSNTISFVGAGKELTKITSVGTTTSDWATVLLNGSDHITFRDMTVASTANAIGIGILLTNMADSNRFINLRVQMDTTSTATNTCGIAITGASTGIGSSGISGNYNLFNQVEVDGAYWGISIYGNTVTSQAKSNNIINCTFTNQAWRGIRTFYATGFEFYRNHISKMRAVNNYGIENSNISNFRIEANTINAVYGINCGVSNVDLYDSTVRSLIVNNVVKTSGENSYGLQLSNSHNVHVLHNTFTSDGIDTRSTANFMNQCTHLDVRNNIFVNTNATPERAHVFNLYDGFTGFDSLDYNNYYSAGGGLVYLTASESYNSLTAWKTIQPGVNQNSWSANPHFVSATDLHLQQYSPSMYGAYVGINTDIDGQPRSLIAPTAGAYQIIAPPENISVEEVVLPQGMLCKGNYDLKVKIRNKGTNPVYSFWVNWELNGSLQIPVYYTGTLDTLGSITGNDTAITLASNMYLSGVPINLKIWTSALNGSTDPLPEDDTLSVVVATALSDTLTIGSVGADFVSFTDVVSALHTYGICGPVVFNVQSGIFQERIVLKGIAGVSVTNNIVFKGSGKNNTILTHTDPTTAANTSGYGTLVLFGTDHITFRDMTIEAAGTVHAVGILLANVADSNRFVNLKIQLDTTTTSSTTVGIAVVNSLTSLSTDGNSGSYNTFDSLDINGGYSGISIRGVSQTAFNKGNNILNCKFTNQYYYGTYYYYQSDFVLYRNNISKIRGTYEISTNNLTSAILLWYGSNFIIEANTIVAPYHGINISNVNIDGGYSKVINNMARVTKAAGLNASVTNNLDVLHNTFVSSNSSVVGSIATMTFSSGTGINCRNNIAVSKGTAAMATYFVYSATTNFTTLDNNIYYSYAPSGYQVYLSAAINFPDLASWKAAYPGYNQNSYSFDPSFYSDTDLRLLPVGKIHYGANVGVNEDIDFTPRANPPVIGAYERVPLYNSAYVADISPRTYCAGSHPVTVKVINSGANIINSLTIKWELNGVLQAPINISTPIDTLESTAGAEALVSLGNVSFALGVNTNIKVWVELPNGLPDPFPSDDTLYFSTQAALSGNFTIGATGNYPTIAAAINDVVTNGLCGSVVFNIEDGSYTEQLNIGTVLSSDLSNTITFQSLSQDTSKVTINWPASATATNNYVVQLDGNRNIIFNKLTFERTGTGAYATIFNLNNTSNIKFLNNQFLAPLSTTTETDGSRSAIYSNEAASEDSTIIDNNVFSRNANAIALFGNRDKPAQGTVIKNNIIDVPYISIWLKHHQSAKINHNNCKRMGTAAIDFIGITLENCDSLLDISYNNISGYNRGHGIRMLGCNGFENSRGRIYNNVISGSQTGTANFSSISIESENNNAAAYLDIVHNTVFIGSASATAGRIINMVGTATSKNDNIRILNNIFVNRGIGYVYNIPNANAIPTNTEINHNNVYTSGVNIGTWGGNAISNDGLRSWISITNQDSLSSNANVNFVNDDELNLTGSSIGDFNLAANITNLVSDDITGYLRTGMFFYKGAYEPVTPLTNNYLGNGSLWAIQSPTAPRAASGIQDLVVKIRNCSYSDITSLGVNYELNGVLGTLTSWSGVLLSNKDMTLTIPNVNVPEGMDTLKVWIEGVNNNSDLNNNNDTLSIIFNASVPLVGNFNVGTGEAYLNLTAIADTLKNKVLGGNVIFNLTNNYDGSTEVYPVSFSAPSNSPYTVTVRPAAGTTVRVTAGDPATTNPVINLDGVSNIILDGRPGGVGNQSGWIIRNTRTAATVGSVIRLINGANNNQLKYLTVEGELTSASYGLVHFSTAAGVLRANSDNLVEHCTLRNRSDVAVNGALYQAIYSSGTAGNLNSNNTIKNNEIFNFTNYGINIGSTGNGNNWVIDSNHFYSNRTVVPTVACTPIYLNPPVETYGYVVSNNFIGGSLKNTGGASWKHNGANAFIAISSVLQELTVYNNTIRNIEQQNIGTGTTVRLCGIEHNRVGSKVVITNNKINNLKSLSRNTALPATGLFALNGILVRAADSVTVADNIIDTLSVAATAATTEITLSAITTTEAIYAAVYNNRIHNLSNLTSGVGRTVGIMTFNVPQNAQHNIYNNKINLTNTSGRMHGIMHANTTIQPGTINVRNNTVYIGGSGAGPDYGVFRQVATSFNMFNNIVYFERSGSSGSAINDNAEQTGLTTNYNFYVQAGSAFNAGTFDAWRALGNDRFGYYATPAELSSASLFTNTAIGNLSVVTSNNTSWALNGKGIADAMISSDFNGNSRSVLLGIPVDIGADEFTPTGVNNEPVVVRVPTTTPTTVLTVYNRPVATVTWRSGTIPDSIDLKYFSGVAPLGATVGNNINSYYSIEAHGGSGYVYDIALAYTPAEIGAVDTTRITIAKTNSSGGWYHRPNSFVNQGEYTVTDTLLNSFSLFTLTDANNPLPVVLTTFNAKAIYDNVLLEWATASEINASHFIVERSTGNNNWEKAGQVKAIGNSNTVSNYNLTDVNAFASGVNTLYYRLKSVDNDGGYEYSKVVSVSREQQIVQSLAAYPNPFSSNVNVEFVSASEGIGNINIVDITGRDVLLNTSKRIVKGNNILNIDTDKLNGGIYFLSVEVNGEKQTIKLVKH